MQAIDLRPRRRGRLRVALAGVLGALALLAVNAGVAAAEPFHLEFDYGFTDEGSQKKVVAINHETPVTMDGEISGTSFTIPQAGVNWPPQAVTEPLPSTAYTEVTGPLTGSYDPVTGEMTMQGQFTFATESSLIGKCTIGPASLTLSTAGTEPYPGYRFREGAAGKGALVVKWASLPDPVGGAKCGIVKTLTSEPGGLWISHLLPEPEEEGETAPPPEEALRAAKLKLIGVRKVVGGRVAKLKARVTNTGSVGLGGLKLCPKAPKPVRAAGCVKIGSLDVGKTVTKTVKVKTKKVARAKSVKLTVKLSGGGIGAKSAKLKLKLTPKAHKGKG